MIQQEALPAVLSNLAKAAEKQQEAATGELLGRLAELVNDNDTAAGEISAIREQIVADGEAGYPGIRERGERDADRGVLRAAKWGEKVNTSQRALIDRFDSKGDDLLDGKSLYVCEACGFIFVGVDPPPVCPVCKAPSGRFSEIR